MKHLNRQNICRLTLLLDSGTAPNMDKLGSPNIVNIDDDKQKSSQLPFKHVTYAQTENKQELNKNYNVKQDTRHVPKNS